MNKSILINILISAAAATPVMAQHGGITDTRNSKYAIINSTPINAVKWTDGFWGERFGVFSGTSLQSMWETWKSDKGHSYNNFMIAAGEKKESVTALLSTTETCTNGLKLWQPSMP